MYRGGTCALHEIKMSRFLSFIQSILYQQWKWGERLSFLKNIFKRLGNRLPGDPAIPRLGVCTSNASRAGFHRDICSSQE